MNAYEIPRLTRNFTVDAHWQKTPWAEIPALEIAAYSGAKPAYVPHTQVKLAYDTEALYVIFHVEDRYVRAVAQNYQDAVFEDSCVEFFFTPGKDMSQGYFNLEVNCGGTALCHHQKGRRVEDVPVAAADFAQVKICRTLPKIVEPEIEEPVTWVVEYRMPFGIFSGYTQVDFPHTGTVWRANLYKCAENNSHPHWLSWAPIDTPAPDFHRPEFFGQLVFE